MVKNYNEEKKISFTERNIKIKHNSVKVYAATLIVSLIVIAVKGFS